MRTKCFSYKISVLRCKKLSYSTSESEKSLISSYSEVSESLNEAKASFFLNNALYNCGGISDLNNYIYNYAVTLLPL